MANRFERPNPVAAGNSLNHQLWAFGLAACLFLILAACLTFEVNSSFNHDLAFILVGAKRLIHGGVFGVDVVDPNPPLAWWMAVIPVELAHFTSMTPEFVAVAFTVFLIAVSAALIWRIAGPLTALSAATILAFAPGYDFGQREHWMAALALPWLLLAALARDNREAPVWLRVTAGTLAALGFCLKPYFLIIPLLVEIWVQAQRRSLRSLFRTENCVLAGLGLLYAAIVIALYPSYFSVVLPYAVHAYWAFDNDPFRVVMAFAVKVVLYAVGCILLLREAKYIPSEAKAMGLAALAAFAAALLQMKGWSYHWLPVKVFAGLGCIILLISIRPEKGRRAFLWIALAPILFATFIDAIVGLQTRANAQEQVRRLSTTLQDLAKPGAPVFAFITSPRTVLPAVLRAGDYWDSAACCVQWLPADVRSKELPPKEAILTQEVAAQRFSLLLRHLQKRPPTVVLIDDRPGKLGFNGKHFDYLPYLRRNPAFDRFFASYQEKPSVVGYRVFVRAHNQALLAQVRPERDLPRDVRKSSLSRQSVSF